LFETVIHLKWLEAAWEKRRVVVALFMDDVAIRYNVREMIILF